jgi:hypothetical protein
MLCKVLHEVRCTLSNTTEHAIQMPDKSTDNRVGRYLNTYIPYHEKRNEDKQGLFVCLGLSICPFSTGKYCTLIFVVMLCCCALSPTDTVGCLLMCSAGPPVRLRPKRVSSLFVDKYVCINHIHNTLQARVSVCMVVS